MSVYENEDYRKPGRKVMKKQKRREKPKKKKVRKIDKKRSKRRKSHLWVTRNTENR